MAKSLFQELKVLALPVTRSCTDLHELCGRPSSEQGLLEDLASEWSEVQNMAEILKPPPDCVEFYSRL